MKKEIFIHKKLILIFAIAALIITLLGGWHAILSAAKETLGFCLFWAMVLLACYGLYKLIQKFKKK
jgi:hypothetical protein